MEAGGDDDLEILDCSTCDRDRAVACAVCPLALGHQPRLSGRAKFYVTLYRRMMAYQALPSAGGLLDQDEATMQILDVIHEELATPPASRIVDSFGTLEGRGR